MFKYLPNTGFTPKIFGRIKKEEEKKPEEKKEEETKVEEKESAEKKIEEKKKEEKELEEKKKEEKPPELKNEGWTSGKFIKGYYNEWKDTVYQGDKRMFSFSFFRFSFFSGYSLIFYFIISFNLMNNMRIFFIYIIYLIFTASAEKVLLADIIEKSKNKKEEDNHLYEERNPAWAGKPLGTGEYEVK